LLSKNQNRIAQGKREGKHGFNTEVLRSLFGMISEALTEPMKTQKAKNKTTANTACFIFAFGD